jgi:hypothetical protein
LPVQFKSLLPGQEGCVFFQWAFKYTYLPPRFTTLRPARGISIHYVKAGKGLIMDGDVSVLQRKTEKVIHDLEWWFNRNDLIINVKKNRKYVIPQETSKGSNQTLG